MATLILVYWTSLAISVVGCLNFIHYQYGIGAKIKDFVLLFLLCAAMTAMPGANTGVAMLTVWYYLVTFWDWFSSGTFMNKTIGGRKA